MKILDREKLAQNIEKVALYDLDNHNVFGSSYYVYQNGETLFKKHYGKVGPDDSAGVNDNTIFRLASMTKPITSFAVLILIDRGLISLDDKISKFLPEFEDIHVITADGKDLGKTKTPITILHCLTHTSGIGSGKAVELSNDDVKTVSATLKRFVEAGLDFEPFTWCAYSSIAAHDVLSVIVEKVTGIDFEEFLKKEIFEPCDMTDTTFSPTEEQWKRLITMHNKVQGVSGPSRMPEGCIFERFPCEHKLAGAGLVSTLKDYTNFARMLLNKGEFNNKRLVSEKTFEKYATPYVPTTIKTGADNWGLSVRIVTGEEYGNLWVGSYGWSGAYGPHFWVDPANNMCAVFMKNSRFDGGAGNASSRRFEEAVFDSYIK